MLIPDDITDEPLQPPDRASLDSESQRLNGLPFELAALPHHIIEEMGPRFTARKTVVEGRLKLPQFLQNPFDITGDNLKCGQSTSFAGSPTAG